MDEQWVDDDDTAALTTLCAPVFRRDWDSEDDAVWDDAVLDDTKHRLDNLEVTDLDEVDWLIDVARAALAYVDTWDNANGVPNEALMALKRALADI